ncbi:unnamed protein product [marine sediment metagenome]|uniref:Uncharacterized protein n=1 Tax=marine sediment metagenome TaxID=412755 RepID=X1T039_9ZZZZ
MRIGRSKARAISEITIDADVDFNSHAITEMGNITMVENSGVQLLAALAVDGGWSGETVIATAGENITKFETVYLNADTTVYRSDATSAATMPIKGIALEDVGIGTTGVFLIKGFYRSDTHGFTVAAFLYASGVVATLTETAPVTGGHQVQRVGIVVSDDIIWFRPDLTVVEVA